MKKDTPRYVVRLAGKGGVKELWFKRRGWTTRRFEAQEMGNVFYAEYARILNKTAPKPKAFLVKGLVRSYYKSNKYQSLKPRTQKDYRKFLDRLERNFGGVMVRTVKRKNVISWRDGLAKTDGAHYANYFVRVLRILFRYAGDIDELPMSENPAQGVEAVKYDKKTPKPWSKDLITAARDARPHGTRTRLLFELLYCTGQRVGDVLAMEWTDIRGDAIDVSQNKTDAALEIPLTDDLKECLRRAERTGETILTPYGESRPLSYRSAAKDMMDLRKEVGAEKHTIHAIRHTVASEIAAGDGDDEEIMSMTGHTTKGMVAHYAGPARQRARAVKAQKKRT